MRPTVDIIADICEEMNGNGYVSKPRMVNFNDFDFIKHKPQESDVEGVKTEFVWQSGAGMMGDDFTGTIGYPIDGMMFVLDYAT